MSAAATRPATPRPALLDGGLLAAAMAVALWLRWPYALQGMWWDEYLVPYYASLTFEQLMRAFVVEEAHPPLYFLLSAWWTRAVGDDPEQLRAISLAAGLVTVPATYLLGRMVLGRREALLAACFVATSPYHVDFSGHARNYTLFTLLGTLSAVGFVGLWRAFARSGERGDPGREERARENGERGDGMRADGAPTPRPWGWAALYGAATGLALLTHYYAVLLVAAHALFYAGARGWRRLPTAWLTGSWLGAAAIFYPWFWISNVLPTSQTFEGALTPWVPGLGWDRLLDTFYEFTRDPFPPAKLALVVAVLAAAVGLGLRRRGRTLPWMLVVHVLAPPVALAGVSIAIARTHGSHVYQPRQMIFLLPAVMLLVALAFGALRSRLALGLALAAFFAQNLAAMPTRSPRLQELCADLAREARPGDVVLVHPVLSEQVLAHYLARIPFGGEAPGGVAVLALTDFGDDAGRVERRLATVLARSNRVFLVERELEANAIGDDARASFERALERLEAGRRLARAHYYGGAITWKLTRYDHAPPAGAPPGEIDLTLVLPARRFPREALLFEAPAASPVWPPQVSDPSPRWFGIAGNAWDPRRLPAEPAERAPFEPAGDEDRARLRVPVPSVRQMAVTPLLFGRALHDQFSPLPLRLTAEHAPPELVVRPLYQRFDRPGLLVLGFVRTWGTRAAVAVVALLAVRRRQRARVAPEVPW